MTLCPNCRATNYVLHRYCYNCSTPLYPSCSPGAINVAADSITALDVFCQTQGIVPDATNGWSWVTADKIEYGPIVASELPPDPCETASTWPKSTQLEVYRHLYNLGCRLEGIDHEIAKAKRAEKDAKAT